MRTSRVVLCAASMALAPTLTQAQDTTRSKADVVVAYIAAFDSAATVVIQTARTMGADSELTATLDSVTTRLRAYYGPRSPSWKEKTKKRFVDTAIGSRAEAVAIALFKEVALDVAKLARDSFPGRLEEFGLTRDSLWPVYARWQNLDAIVARSLIDHRLERYRVRYAGGEVLNVWAEVPLDNLFIRWGWFGASQTSAGRGEPILRLTPLMYSSASEVTTTVLEAGLNIYSFGGLMRCLNPVGLAFVFGDPTQAKLTDVRRKRWKTGAVLHVRRFEFGFLPDHTGRKHFLTTVNFHVLPWPLF